ncbi:hypothetical protein ACJX0J_011919 [Zea mays]
MPFVRMNKGKNPGIHGKVRDTEELKSAKGMVSDFGVYTSLINEFVKKKLIYMVKVPYWAVSTHTRLGSLLYNRFHDSLLVCVAVHSALSVHGICTETFMIQDAMEMFEEIA